MDFTELIPGLPEELALQILTRIPYPAHRVSSHVCRRWRHLLRSKEFYHHRRRTGFTRKAACLVQALPAQPGHKPPAQQTYGISLFDPASLAWDRVDPVPDYPDGLPLFCQVGSTEGKLVLMGGWDPSSWEAVRGVYVHDFTARRWTRCADMPSTRSFFAIGAAGGRVYVAGGHDGGKNALDSAWAFDVRRNEWSELSRMGEERDECGGGVIGSEFWVVSGYGTEAQGGFKGSAEVYEIGEGRWRRVEEAWPARRSPRSSVGVERGKNGSSLVCWTEVEGCGVDLGGRTLVTGSGGPHEFHMKEWHKGKLSKVEVPDGYSGLVQSGCCVEI